MRAGEDPLHGAGRGHLLRGRRAGALSARRRQARRSRLRRWSAALLLAAAALVAVASLRPPPAAPRGLPTVVAARDLPAGALVTEADLALADRLDEDRPASALTAYGPVLGRRTAGPISARDTVTTERLSGAGQLVGQAPDTVAVTVPVLPLGGAGVTPGSRVDLYATGSGRLTVADAVVLAVSGAATPGAAPGLGGDDGSTLTLAVPSRSVGGVAASLSTLQAGEGQLVAVRR